MNCASAKMQTGLRFFLGLFYLKKRGLPRGGKPKKYFPSKISENFFLGLFARCQFRRKRMGGQVRYGCEFHGTYAEAE
jgi:hypothetical protein